MSKGKDFIVRSELDPQMQGLFDFVAKKLNVTDGRITLQQFRSLSQNKEEGSGKKTRAATPPTPGATTANRTEIMRNNAARSFANPSNFANWGDDAFNKADANHDGVLDFNEMRDELRDTIDTWDHDENGMINLSEYREFHVALIQQRLTERDEDGIATPWSNTGHDPGSMGNLSRDRKPLVYNHQNLPRDLPSWFNDRDDNEDAQVSLREWRMDKKKSLDDFVRMDRNNDGFLTVDEVIRHQTRGANGLNYAAPARNDAVVRGAAVPPGNNGMVGNGNGNNGNNGNGGDRRNFRRGGDEGGERRNWPRWGEGGGGERRMMVRPGGGDRDNGGRRPGGRPGGNDGERKDAPPSAPKPTGK